MLKSVRDFADELHEKYLNDEAKRISRDALTQYLQLVYYAAQIPEERVCAPIRAVLANGWDLDSLQEHLSLTQLEPALEINPQKLAKLAAAIPGTGEFLITAQKDGLGLWGIGLRSANKFVNSFWEGTLPRIRARSAEPGTIDVPLEGHWARFHAGGWTFVPRESKGIAPVIDFLKPAAEDLEREARNRTERNPALYAVLALGYGRGALQYFVNALYRTIGSMKKGGTLFFAAKSRIQELRKQQILAEGNWIKEHTVPGYTLHMINTLIGRASESDDDIVKSNMENGKPWSWRETQQKLDSADSNGLAWSLGDVQQALQVIASYSAIDGAVVVDELLRVHAFGVKLQPEKDCPKQIKFFREANLDREGPVERGTRHRSAVATTTDNHGTVAAIFSQDGGSWTSWNAAENDPCVELRDL